MVYFAISIFLSAFLLFQVEPMIARIILPWFGGTSAVWSTVQMFFQVLLTGGYAYANWLTGKRRRGIIHLVVIGISVGLLVILSLVWKSPIIPDANWKPVQSNFPIWEICKLLFVSVGLPFFLLSANSPLMQAWFHRASPNETAYRLYALSNVGSLLGLMTYPVLVEPYLTLAWQGRFWSVLFLVYAGMAAYGAVRSMRIEPAQLETPNPRRSEPELRPSIKVQTLWILLPATASILLLATTSQITQEVAVIPFLWVLPLTMYLLSFILAFSGERWYSRQVYLVILFLATVLISWALGRSEALGIPAQIGIYLLGLFAACMVCHGELYLIRPNPIHLTRFYLMVSVGGALGGLVVNFVAPFIFKGFWELPIGYTLCWLLFLVVTFLFRSGLRKRWLFVLNNVLLMGMVIISGVRSYMQIHSDLTSSLTIERNFYGVVSVREFGLPGSSSDRFVLVHGVTIHGFQYVAAAQRDFPTAYFGGGSGGGLAILNHPRRGLGMRVGILGLGVGTLASYGQPGDVYRFYEINPLIIQLAEGQGGFFSFLADSRAKIEIVLGDARLSLERELAISGSQNYDVLALDVFSSDSIPVHLLDREAFALYLQHLQPDGILAVHISNLHLDLVPVVWTLADTFNLSRIEIADPGNGVKNFPSVWVLLARDPSLLETPALLSRARPMEGYVSPIRLWTDDYSNLLQILK